MEHANQTEFLMAVAGLTRGGGERMWRLVADEGGEQNLTALQAWKALGMTAEVLLCWRSV